MSNRETLYQNSEIVDSSGGSRYRALPQSEEIDVELSSAFAGTTDSSLEQLESIERDTLCPQSSNASGRENPKSNRRGKKHFDGVFRNMMAKTDLKAEELPPSYEQAAADNAPSYLNASVIAPSLAIDGIYVEKMAVGSICSLALNLLVSLAFGPVGSLLTYTLSTTHAARCGSLLGLGIGFIQMGLYLQTDQSPSDLDSEDADLYVNILKAFLLFLMALGWFICIKSIVKFYQVKRIERLLKESPTLPQ